MILKNETLALFGGFLALGVASMTGCAGDDEPPSGEEPSSEGSGGMESASGGNIGDASGGTGGQPVEGSGGTEPSETGGGGGAPAQDDSQSAGCFDGAGLAEGVRTFMSDDRERRYMLALPENYSAESDWPLVLALHPNNGDLGYWLNATPGRDLEGVLGEEAIVVHLEAIDGQWRNYDLNSSEWPALLEEELEYIDAALSEVQAELCVDLEKIFALGFSGGGSFAGVLSCRRDDLRAFAAGGAVRYFDEANCIGNSAAFIQIGENDLNSGREEFRDWFRDRSECQETSEATVPESCVAYAGCAEGRPVVYCEPAGVGHEVPEFFSSAAWDFFQSLE